MNKNLMVLLIMMGITGCDNASMAPPPRAALEQLTCESSKEGRTHEELQVIADSCFRKGTFVKSSGKAW